MPDYLFHIIFVVARWLHVVASMLLVGGTFFFEFVVPRAVDDLKLEQQLSIIGRMRWVFRKITWGCVVLLPITGAFSIYQLWPGYMKPNGNLSTWGYWAMAHVVGGLITVGIAAALVIGGKVPERTRGWLKVNFVIMLAVIFLASAGRHVRMFARDQQWRTDTVVPLTNPMPTR